MKYFSITQPAAKEFLKSAVLERGLDWKKFKNKSFPREDYFLVSQKFPIFAVADGITLELDKNGNYPNPSGASQAAKIFCQSAVFLLEKKWEKSGPEIISVLPKIFSKSNREIKRFNQDCGVSKKKINYFDIDFFGCVGVFAAIKGKKIFWGGINDCQLAIFGKNNHLKFISPIKKIREKIKKLDTKKLSQDEKRALFRKLFRNALSKNGDLAGYGAATGEKEAEKYFSRGEEKIAPGDLIFLFSDGFKNYLELPEFLKLFRGDQEKLNIKIKSFSRSKIEENPEKFGHERTLIAIKA